MVRPESVSVSGERAESENAVIGVVKDIIMSGSAKKCFVQVVDGPLVSASQPTRRSRTSLKPGDAVWLGWNGEDTVILE